MKYRYQSGDMIYEVLLERHDSGYRVTVNDETYELEVLDAQPGALSLRFGQQGDRIKPQVVYWGAEGDVKWLSSGGCTYRLDQPKERTGPGRRRGGTGAGLAEETLRAPMPAQVRAVHVTEGDAVEPGQTLLLLEAMKMEIKLPSPRAGQVAHVLAKQGDTVERDQVLIELRPGGDEGIGR
jgi:acetyl/propionyl-CoA carboxylase alpha subunit